MYKRLLNYVEKHNILSNFTKLQHYGIRGTCLQWFMNYLNGRTQIAEAKQHA
jgi:hypothetical protein